MFTNTSMRRATLAVAAIAFGLPAAAASLNVSVTNNFASGGLSLTPLWVAFHDDNFDAFDVGGTASAGVEQLAEVGNPATVAGELLAADADAVSGAITATDVNAHPTINPGETGIATFDVDAQNARFFSYLSMIIPSNDTFFGSDEALELFDVNGDFLGAQVITITAADLYDAGTEVNDINDGPAFVVGQSGGAGTDENGTIGKVGDLSEFFGANTPVGAITSLPDFTISDLSSIVVATITVSEVAPVPSPAGAVLGLTGLAALGLVKRRKA